MLPIKFNIVSSFIKTMNNAPVQQVALGFTLGMFLGLIPLSINSIIITFLLFILNVDSFAGVIAAGIFGFFGLVIDPLAHLLGYQLLVNIDFLKPIWTTFYNLPLIPFTRFNNTIVMGNTALGLALAVPLYFIIKALVSYFRTTKGKEFLDKVAESKIMKLGKALNIFGTLKEKFNLFKK